MAVGVKQQPDSSSQEGPVAPSSDEKNLLRLRFTRHIGYPTPVTASYATTGIMGSYLWMDMKEFKIH
jgi:hypothetical protein